MVLTFNKSTAVPVKLSPKSWKPRTLAEIQTSDMKRVVRIYTDGVYDLFHPGHVQQLRQAKEAFPNVYLIVGVCTDEDTLKFKGCLPIMKTNERAIMIRQCKYVDEVMVTPVFFPTVEFANDLKIDLVAHDSLPYRVPDSDDCYASFKALNRFLTTERTPNVSTTEILNRILGKLDNIKYRQILRNV